MEALENLPTPPPDFPSDFFKVIEHLCFKCGKVLAKTVFFDPQSSGWNFDRVLCGQCDKSKHHYTCRTSLVQSNELSNHFNANVTERSCGQEPGCAQDAADGPRPQRGVKRTAAETEVADAGTETASNEESREKEKDDRPQPQKRSRSSSIRNVARTAAGEPTKPVRSKRAAIAHSENENHQKVHLGGSEENFVKLPERKLRCLKCHGVISSDHRTSLTHEVRCVRGMIFKCIECNDFGSLYPLIGSAISHRSSPS